MLRLPAFEHHAPKSVPEAVALLRALGPEARVLAGGTDLLPNMKHEVTTPRHVVSLRSVEGLTGLCEAEDGLHVGAMTPLQALADDPRVRAWAPALAEAAGEVAGPQLRRMGTLGGNVLLDTRCVYINQTHFWRAALGFCLKKDGTACHVVTSGRRCVAAASNDTAPVLMALGAEATFVSADGRRVVPLRALYVADGVKNTDVRHDELLVSVRLPRPGAGQRSAFEKLRMRAAIDFPILNVAVAWDEGADGALTGPLEVVVSALAARPHRVKRLEAFAGRRLDAGAIDEVAERARRECVPLTNINVDPEWRRDMVPVLVKRALERAAARGRGA